VDERRERPRLALETTAVVRLGSLSEQSQVINASERGLMLMLPAARPVGTRIHITLHVGDPPARIEISGIIVHVTVLDSVGPRPPARAGIFITEAGPEWAELCRSLPVR
jgi:hypothetical protein